MSPTPERHPDQHVPDDELPNDGSNPGSAEEQAPDFDWTTTDAPVRPSLSIKMIRHAESQNNQVYRDARRLFRGGCPDFDGPGWCNYVDTHRQADPPLSALGRMQANKLADHLVPHLCNQASHPIHIITSPMKRTLETIRPTLHGLAQQLGDFSSFSSSSSSSPTQVLVHGFYFESEGCHVRERAEEGMNPDSIRQFLAGEEDTAEASVLPGTNIQFEGFPDPHRGWYVEGTSSESREQAEERASRFYVWLLDALDRELQDQQDQRQHHAGSGVFDAGVSVPGEEHEDEHDLLAPRIRRRKTTLLVGHGDFMSLVLKRMVTGFGHVIEQPGLPHRSAFVHFNTGITELEYFGCGRFLLMTHNHTPHLAPHEYSQLRSGGSLKDGWSYLVPRDDFVLRSEASSVSFADEWDEHVRDQTKALRALYLSSYQSDTLRANTGLSIEANSDAAGDGCSSIDDPSPAHGVRHFLVKRGMQVVGVATYCNTTGLVTDVAVQPSAGRDASETLFDAVKTHAKKLGRSGSLLVYPKSPECKALFQDIGFLERSDTSDNTVLPMELKH